MFVGAQMAWSGATERPALGLGRRPWPCEAAGMTRGTGDTEEGLRAKLGLDACAYVNLLRSRTTTTDAAIDSLVRRASGSPDRLRDAADLLGEDFSEAAALLRRAVRRAADPPPLEPPQHFARWEAPRPLSRPETLRRQPGG